MPWLATAPRIWPVPRPRLRLVKADPNPFAALSPAHLSQAHAGILEDIADPQYQAHVPQLQQQLAQVEQLMQAQGIPIPGAAPPAPATPSPTPATPPPLDSVAEWEKLVTLAEAAAPKMQQVLLDAFDWGKLPSGVQQALLQGQVSQALSLMNDFGMQQMEASYVPAFTALAEKLFTDVANAQWPAMRQLLLQTDIPLEMPTKFPDDLMVQRALRYVRQEGLTRAKNLWAPTIEASREIIRVGLAEGKTNEKIARELREHIGLLPGQGKQLMAYNNGLIEAGTPPAKIDTLTDKFANKLLRRRTLVIARTETNAALNIAADTFFAAASGMANLPETALRRFWLITFDSRTCPICRAIPPANEQGKLFDEPFMTSKGPLLRPPAHPQCRCVVIVRPAIIATPALAPPMPGVPTPPVLPPPVPFPPPLPTPPPKVKKPAKPKKPKAPAATPPPPPAVSEQYTSASAPPPWATTPKPNFWESVTDVDVGPLPALPTGKLSTGVVMIEDGKVWVYEPKNHFGGYSTAFPKGTLEKGLSPQQNALKEVFEETGLHAKVTGFLGDFQATTGTTRLYLGQKIGGNPTQFGDETWSVTLMTPTDLEKALVAQGHSYPLQALQALKDKGLLPQTTAPVPPPAAPVLPPLTPQPPLPTATPTPPVVPPTTAPQAPKAPVKAKPLKASEKIEQDTVRGELVQNLGGSTGAKLYRGTDGVQRVMKEPATGQAYEEFLANKLYKELGVDTPEQQLVLKDGKITGVAAPFLAGGETLERAGITKARAQEVLKGFVADVWLMNRDAVGLTMDNILVRGDRLTRIDNGGSLHYRAQGTLKPKDDLGQLKEWQGLQNPSLNRAYARVFQESGYGTPENIPDLVDQVRKLQDLRDRTNGFADLVPAAKGITAKQRQDLVQLLRKRATLLEEQVGLKAPAAPRRSDAEMTARLRKEIGSAYDYHVRGLRSKAVPPAMAEHEAVAIYAYTGNDYRPMNRPFWTIYSEAERRQMYSEAEARIESGMQGLPKLRAGAANKTYYRGVETVTPQQRALLTVGNTVTLEGFASTSSKRSVSVHTFHGDRNLFIILGKGGNYDVRPLSAVGTHEAEYLYPPNAQFLVTGLGRDEDNPGQYVYYLEEVPAVNKRRNTQKADTRSEYDRMVDSLPQPDDGIDVKGWSQAEIDALTKRIWAEIDAEVLTPEEADAAARFADKQASTNIGPAQP